MVDSYRKLSGWADLNRRPLGPEPFTLQNKPQKTPFGLPFATQYTVMGGLLCRVWFKIGSKPVGASRSLYILNLHPAFRYHNDEAEHVDSASATCLSTEVAMPRKISALLPPLELGSESVGRPISRLGKSHGYKQSQLAAQIGISNRLVSDCEYRRLPLNDEMVVRFALALHVSTDEFLGLRPRAGRGRGIRCAYHAPSHENRTTTGNPTGRAASYHRRWLSGIPGNDREEEQLMPRMNVNLTIDELAATIAHLDGQERETLLLLLTPDGEELRDRKRELDQGKVQTLSESQLFDD